MVCTLTSPRISVKNCHESLETTVVVTVCLCSHMPICNRWHLLYVGYGCGMQFERLYILNHSVVAWFALLHYLGFQTTLLNLWNICGGGGVLVQPYVYANPQQMKVLKHLLYVGYGYGMQFVRFYSLNHNSTMVYTLTSPRISAKHCH